MSLSPAQRRATKEELAEALRRSGLSEESAARDLNVSVDALRRVMDLRGDALEDPWILRDYLADAMVAAGNEPVEFSALRGDPADHWFLDASRIRSRRLTTR